MKAATTPAPFGDRRSAQLSSASFRDNTSFIEREDAVLVERVTSALLSRRDDSLELALWMIKRELEIDRICVNQFIDGRFEVLAVAGATMFDPGTKLPFEASTHCKTVAENKVFASANFRNDERFVLPVDELVRSMGFRSGCGIPLVVGEEVLGAISLSARRADEDFSPIVRSLSTVTGMLAMELYKRRREDASPATLLVLHHDPLVLAGLTHIIERELGARVLQGTSVEEVAEVSDLSEIAASVLPTFLGGRRVDEVREELHGFGIRGDIIVVANHDTEMNRAVASHVRARGYITRAEGGAHGVLAQTIEDVLAGRAKPLEVEGVLQPGLTPREREVLLALSSGLQVDEIAREMMIATSTARGYVQQVYRKLGVHSRAQAVDEAERQGLLESLRGGPV
jgi:DNA-binding NarL/FixJ family response regulator